MAVPRRRRLVRSLRLLWLVAIIWCEYGLWRVRSCGWPDVVTLNNSVPSTTLPNRTHVLVVADPHILHRDSYPERPALFTFLTRLAVHTNLRKNWNAALRQRPDAVVFMGDMLDLGRERMTDREYDDYYKQFKSVFRVPSDIPQHFVPGNRDIGLSSYHFRSGNAHRRFTSHFGPLNSNTSIADHHFVFFDAPGYVDEDTKRHGMRLEVYQWKPLAGGSLEYLEKLSKAKSAEPLLLFTHIPLYRPDGSGCGPHRESGLLRPGVGSGWQNTIEKQSSIRLLRTLQPTAIFSADNHDYCEYLHRSILGDVQSPGIPEVTVKTISMASRVQHPGYQLLTLVPKEHRQEGQPTYSHSLCLLPNQTKIYVGVYIPLFAFTLLSIVVSNVFLRHSSRLSNNRRPTGGSHWNGDDVSDEERMVISTSTSVPHIAPSQRRIGLVPRNGWRLVTEEKEQPGNPFSGLNSIYDAVAAPFAHSSDRKRWIASGRDFRDVMMYAAAGSVALYCWNTF